MTHFETVDTDGAIQESLDGLNRSGFLKAGGAVLTSGAIMAMLPDIAHADGKLSKKRDIVILNYALTLEYLEAAFYAEAVGGTALSGAVLETAKLISAHETTHVTALKKTIKSLGGKAVASPSFDFMGTTGAQDSFLQTAFVLENTGVHAYLGQAANLLQKPLLIAAATIVTTEARHAAAIAGLINDTPYDINGGGKNYTPSGAFDTPWSKKRVLKNVGATGFIVS